jgi:hypothetical protein
MTAASVRGGAHKQPLGLIKVACGSVVCDLHTVQYNVGHNSFPLRNDLPPSHNSSRLSRPLCYQRLRPLWPYVDRRQRS